MMESLLLPSAMPARDCRPNQNPMWYEFFPVLSISILIKFILSTLLNTFVVTSHIIYTQWPCRQGDDAMIFFFCFFFLRSNEMPRQWLWRTYRWPHLERTLTDTHEWAVEIFVCKKSNCFLCARAVHPFRISMRWSLFSVTALVAARTGGSDYRLWTEKFDHSFMAINVIFSTTFRPSEMALWSLNEIVVKYISGFTSIGFVCRIHVSKTWIEMRFSSSVRPECILKENRRVDKYLMITKTIITVRWYGHNHRTAWRSQNRNWM